MRHSRAKVLVFVPAAVVLVTLMSLQSEGADEGTKVYDMVLPSTVWIVHPTDQTHVSAGTGSVIDPGNRIVLTNYHVVAEESTVYAVFPQRDSKKNIIAETEHYFNMLNKNQAIAAKVLARLPKVDLAVIKLEKMPAGVPALPISRESAKVGQTVYSIGNPHGGMWLLTTGTVRQLKHEKVETQGEGGRQGFTLDCRVVLTQSPTNHGDSGGPLVNSNGELVAVTQGGLTESNSMSIFVDRSEVLEFLKQAKVTPKVGRGEATEVAEKPASPADTKTAATETKSAAQEKPADDTKAAPAKPAASGASADESKAAGKLKIARTLLDKGFDVDARVKLEDVVEKYPGTKAAGEAKDLLDKMKKNK